jgi:hypothetical protein
VGGENQVNRLSYEVRYRRAALRRWLFDDGLPMKLAWLLPRRVALWAFIRVYACTGDCPGPDYSKCYKAWEAGAGK